MTASAFSTIIVPHFTDGVALEYACDTTGFYHTGLGADKERTAQCRCHKIVTTGVSMEGKGLLVLVAIIYACVGLVCGSLCQRVAEEKGYNVWSWFWAGFLLGIVGSGSVSS